VQTILIGLVDDGMRFLQKLLNRFNGLHYRQEYLCTGLETFENPLHVYLVDNGKVIKDITNQHCFVGYCPLVFALPSSLGVKNDVQLAFASSPYRVNEMLKKNDIVASLQLKKIGQTEVSDNVVRFYEGVEGHHRFISSLHQRMVRLNNYLYGKKPGNVFLEGNLYEQVQIAYSLPRRICLVTVAQNNLYNLFPTDLHGKVDDDHYVISLRHAGKACEQVENAKRLVLSDISANFFRQVYSLGKNHMQPLKDQSAFNFSAIQSKYWGWFLPDGAISYRELELQQSFVHGIHKIFLFRTLHVEQIATGSQTLSHIHNCYATWRNKRGMSGNYLLR
jgi:hypothetical protein